MQLRKYQTRAQSAVFNAWRSHKRVVAVMPTGAGKTVTGSSVVKAAVAKGHSVVWLAHRGELLTQAKKTLELVIGCSVGIIAPGIDPDPTAPVQVASIQTLLARETKIDAKLLVVDECHHMAESAPEWAKVLTQFQDAHWLGLTATPERGDGTGLAPLWHTIVEGATYAELLTLGKLIPCRVLRPDGYDSSALATNPADAYMKHAPGTQAVVYAATVKDAQNYVADFAAHGVKAACIYGAMATEDREKILKAFKAGQIQVLTNVYVLTEGWDAPNAQTCIIARGCGSAGTFIQMCGRVMRPDPSDSTKTECLLLDLTGVSEIHGHPQAERSYSLTGKGIELAAKAATKREKAAKEKEEKDRKEQEAKAILERGLQEMSPLGLDARAQWDKLQEVCRAREFSMGWAQRQFREKFGTKPPSMWINDEMRSLEFRKLQQDARDKGYKVGWAMHRYKTMFGDWPKGFRGQRKKK